MAKETAWKNNYVRLRWYSLSNGYSIGIEFDSPKSIVTIEISPEKYVVDVNDKLSPLPDDLRSQITYLFRKQYETIERFVLNKNITVSFTDDFWCENSTSPYYHHFQYRNRSKKSDLFPIKYDHDQLATEDPRKIWGKNYEILNNKNMNDLIHPLYSSILF